MFYGDETLTTPVSDRNSVFVTDLIVSATGEAQLQGVVEVDWFEVPAGGRVEAVGREPFTVRAARIIINGEVDASFEGGQGSETAVGEGPGGGGISADDQNFQQQAGGGGGGYGGRGGNGGYDTNDNVPVGGTTYGSPSGLEISEGSAGGGSFGESGGAGGGALTLRGQRITVGSGGEIRSNGRDGDNDNGNGSGGGSGGGILLLGRVLQLDGTIEADGGNGANGGGRNSDGGGGGGGGRIKLFHEAGLFDNATVSVQPGSGGSGGSDAEGRDGQAGTIFRAEQDGVSGVLVRFGQETEFPIPDPESDNDEDDGGCGVNPRGASTLLGWLLIAGLALLAVGRRRG